VISDEELRNLFRDAQDGWPDVDLSLVAGEPTETISDELRARVLARVAGMSARLLGAQIQASVAEAGWSVDDWAEEAGSKKRDARELAEGKAGPSRLPVALLARLLSLVDLDPRDILGLVKQAYVSSAVYPVTPEGIVFARTSGLSPSARTDALQSTAMVRDVERAAREAQAYADELVERWQRLKNTED
jgi:hypothetical protein